MCFRVLLLGELAVGRLTEYRARSSKRVLSFASYTNRKHPGEKELALRRDSVTNNSSLHGGCRGSSVYGNYEANDNN